MTAMPTEPREPEPDPNDPRTALMNRVREAVLALPTYFESPTNIEGLAATDLFVLNTVLGATIEIQVVETLNRMRDVWDPDNDWPLFAFERQAQTFPDVLLRRRKSDRSHEVAMGIELKGWYILAKEGVPSFRYTVTRDACTDWDLLMVVPWRLSNVLSGVARVGTPGIWSAKYTADSRNHWWQHVRNTSLSRRIDSPEHVEPYTTRDRTADRPVYDRGGNFGRIARIGIMADWIQETLRQPLAGIPARDWISFIRKYADDSDPDEVRASLEQEVRQQLTGGSERAAREAMDALQRFVDVVSRE